MKDRIKQIRKAFKMTQEQFAEKIGVKRSTIAAYETGNNTPLDPIVKSICEKFNVREEWLRTGEGAMEAPPEPTFPENAALIEKVSEEYNLTETEKALLTLYLEIGPEGRDRLNAYALQMFRESLKNPPPQSAPLTEDEIAERVAAYESLLKGIQQIERLPDASTETPKPTSASSGISAAS